jgi:hypothetical protein
MYFSQKDAQDDQHVNGFYDPQGKNLPATLPMYMVPDGTPGHKPNPLACLPTGGYCSKQ